MKRALLIAASLAMLAGPVLPASAGTEASPTPLKPTNDAPRALTWSGSVTPAQSETYWFKAALGKAREARVTTWIHWGTPEDLAVTILDAAGNRVAGSDTDPGEDEIASFNIRNGKTYQVLVESIAGTQTAYDGYLWVRSVAGNDFKGPGKLKYAKKDVLATVQVPINIVFVGFDKAEVDANKQTVLEQLPPKFRPVIRIGSSLGGTGIVRRDGNPDTRETLFKTFDVGGEQFSIAGGSNMIYEPLEYTYKYNFVNTSDAWTQEFFKAARRASSDGDFGLAFDRDFIERYNARGTPLRAAAGGEPVAPGADIQFVEGMKLEDWVAANPPAGLDFDLDKPANGYTYFVVDSFRSQHASLGFDADRYHNFRVMNELTTDPDAGTQNGFDWGRVWGGRYRFLMLDTGAAPNGWEAPVTLANTKIFRLEANGDSSAYDPPIWHYNDANIADFYARLGEDVQWAIWMRFTRGYLYRPRAYDKFILAANTWHDADAYVPWPSKLEELYKDKLVLQRYKELLPYSDFEAFSRFKYLTKDDPEQKALDEGKNQSVSRLPVPFTVNTHPTMLLIDRNRPKYAPLEPGAFTIPVINAVFPTFYTWSLPAIVGGVAEGEGGDAWGQLQNVNNRTKTAKATKSVTDSAGTKHDPVAPDPRTDGVDNIARFGFTATALHEAGHFLGLSHNHDAVGYDWRIGPSGDPAGYFETVDWMYTTTATPMGYGWEYNKFEVMDKDNAWIGHALEWLSVAQDNLADAYAALDQKKFTSVPAAVKSVQASTEATIAAAVAALKGGRYLDAVTTARAAARMSEKTVATAATQVLGARVTRRVGGGTLPSTGVEDGVWFALALILVAAGAGLGARTRLR